MQVNPPQITPSMEEMEFIKGPPFDDTFHPILFPKALETHLFQEFGGWEGDKNWILECQFERFSP